MKRQKYKIINQRFFILSALLLLFAALNFFISARADDYLKRANDFKAQKKWDQAISLLEKGVEQEPLNAERQKQLLRLYILSGKQYEAQALIAKNRILNPYTVEPVYMEALFKINLLVAEENQPEEEKKLADLFKLLQEIENLGNEKDAIEKLFLKGFIARLQGDQKAAEDYFSRILYQEPKHLQALQMLIDIYTSQGELKIATPLVLQAMDIDSHNVDNYYLLGAIFLKKGDPSRAIKYFKHSEEFDPLERPKRLFFIAQAQHQIGKTADAAETYLKLLSYWPNRSDVWFVYAQLMDNLGNSNTAISAYQRAYSLQPDIINPFLSQAEMIFWTQSVIKAYPLYRRIYQIAPERKDILALMVSMQYYLWQLGISISKIDTDELEGWIKHHESEADDITLRIAKLQLEALKNQNWTDESKKDLNGIAEKIMGPSFTKAEAYILLELSDKAQNEWNQLEIPGNIHAIAQQSVLIGAWPWAVKMVDQRSDIISSWVNNWAERELKNSNEQLANADMFIKSNRMEDALISLQKAKAYHPLSSEIQILFAKVYLAQEKLDESQKALDIAINLGVPSSKTLQFMELKKQLEIANLRKTKKNKKR